MLDEIAMLARSQELLALLTHYVEAEPRGRTAWRPRVTELPNVHAKTLIQLHGFLIAHQWIEQNMDVKGPMSAANAFGQYCATSAGIRALQRAQELQTGAAAEAA